jgi:hypothetical protein
MKLGFDYRVQVSRMVLIPFHVTYVSDERQVTSVPVGRAHRSSSSHVTADTPFPRRPPSGLWREFISSASAPSLLRTIKLRVVPTCTGNQAQ